MSKKAIPIEKAQVSLPPPGIQTRFSLLGTSNTANKTIDYTRRANGQVYYEMFRQHPVVRAAIERKSTYASAGGWNFVSTEPGQVPDAGKVKRLKEFCRKSNLKQLLRLTYKDIDIYGESFWAIISGKDQARTPIKAVRLNPRFMQARLDSAGMITGWEYGPISGDSKAIQYEAKEVLHYKLDDPEDDTRGLSPLHSLQRAVTQDIFAMEFNESFFKNSAQTGIVFVIKNSSQEEAERNRAWIEQNYSGPENAHRPLLIEGDVSVEKSVARPAEMEFLEGRKFLRQEILMVLEMDPDKVGVHEDSNRSTSKESAYAFLSEVIWPRQNIVEDEFNNGFILGRFGWDDIVVDSAEGDPRRNIDMAEVYDKHQNAGRLSVNDARRKMGEAPIDGGDEPFIMTPTGIVFVKNLPEMQKQAMEAAQQPADLLAKPPIAAKPTKQPLTRIKADAVKQGENK